MVGKAHAFVDFRAKLQNTGPLIYMSLNNKSIYFDMTRSSKPFDKLDLSGPVFCSCSTACVII